MGDPSSSVCRGVGVHDCQGDPRCDGAVPGTGDCTSDCGYDDPTCSSTTGGIRVLLDGVELFGYPTAKSLVCLELQYTTDQYLTGPPSAQIIVTHEQPGMLEADLVGFADDHGHCDEKWGFVRLQGNCADVLLEKWNWNPCNTEHHTDQLKLETWVDTNGDCSYDGDENEEPYGGHVSWSSATVYKLRIEWQ